MARQKIGGPILHEINRERAQPYRRNPWRRQFLKHYARTGNLTRSAHAANTTVDVVQDLLAYDPGFAREFANAKQAAVDLVLAAAWEMGVTGQIEEVYFGGEVVGHRRVRDPKMTQFLLKALDPPTYSERTRIAQMGQVAIGELARRRVEMLAAADRRLEQISQRQLPAPIDVEEAELTDEEEEAEEQRTADAIEDTAARIAGLNGV